jgi:hypothetical protein
MHGDAQFAITTAQTVQEVFWERSLALLPLLASPMPPSVLLLQQNGSAESPKAGGGSGGGSGGGGEIDRLMTGLVFLFPALGGALFGYDIGATSGALVSLTSAATSGTDWCVTAPSSGWIRG